jgi:hypothetical protein
VSERKWWEPIKASEVAISNGESENVWLCDNDGDWQEKADALWSEIARLKARIAALEEAGEEMRKRVEFVSIGTLDCVAAWIAATKETP